MGVALRGAANWVRHMKILHVASFMGNIGDNASHLGLTRILRGLIGEFEETRLEIRDFYKRVPADRRRQFDQSFVDYANGFDLLVIGGGGFLDYWVEGSATGTTIDISADHLARLTVPTLFASMGSHPHKPVPPGNIDKFCAFVRQIRSLPNMRLLPRNDGSILQMGKLLDAETLSGIHEILDNGYFYEQTTFDRYPALIEGSYVAWNITTDQLTMNASLNDQAATETYYRRLADAVVAISRERGWQHVFVPHISSDLTAISRLFALLPDELLRRDVMVAPYGEGDAATGFAFNVYRQSRLTVGMRFHANVCPIALGVNTIGLGVLDRIKYIYDYFAMPERCFDVGQDFAKPLADAVCAAVPNERCSEILAAAREQSLQTYRQALNDIL